MRDNEDEPTLTVPPVARVVVIGVKPTILVVPVRFE